MDPEIETRRRVLGLPLEYVMGLADGSRRFAGNLFSSLTFTPPPTATDRRATLTKHCPGPATSYRSGH